LWCERHGFSQASLKFWKRTIKDENGLVTSEREDVVTVEFFLNLK
jgi:hypothetical protein